VSCIRPGLRVVMVGSMRSPWYKLLLLGWLLGGVGCASTPSAPTPATPALPTSAQAGATTIVAVAPPPAAAAPHPTLPEFLGINGLFQCVGGGIDRIRNRLGNRFPGLEATPPMLAITDPANMSENSPPAVKAAAEAKAEEDAAPQKAKAIRYLATLGCTDCYPNVEPALLAALDDCTESVRYEAVVAIRKLCGGPCSSCTANECCSEGIVKKLDQIANQQDDQGCYKEPSARVRRVARLALTCCGGPPAPVELPAEGPREEPLPTPAEVQTAGGVHDPWPGLDGPVAQVNGRPIWKQDVLQAVEFRLAAAMDQGQGAIAEPSHEHFHAELQRLIDRTLLYEDALRAERRGVHTTLVSHEAPGAAESARHAPAGRGNTTGGSRPPVSPAQQEQRVAADWLARNTAVNELVTRQELFHHYRTHADRYRQPAAVRWEHTFSADRQFGGREVARQAMQHLRQAALGATSSPAPPLPLDRVAAQTYGWTQREDFPSSLLAHWLFSLPVGKLSPLIEDHDGVHLVRVLQQRTAVQVPLEQVAEEIRQEILQRRRSEAEATYLESLRREADVWTVFDED
jgi:hypothetical protein